MTEPRRGQRRSHIPGNGTCDLCMSNIADCLSIQLRVWEYTFAGYWIIKNGSLIASKNCWAVP